MSKKFPKEYHCGCSFQPHDRFTGVLIIQKQGKEYYLEGKLHREDGPAFVFNNGVASWHLNDVEYTKEQFELLYMLKYKKLLNYKFSNDFDKNGIPISYNEATEKEYWHDIGYHPNRNRI